MIRTAESYPTRYEADKHPGEFVVAKEPMQSGGYEWAVLWHPMQNTRYPSITDGIYIEISSYQNRYLLLDCRATTPCANRSQLGDRKRFEYEEFEEALATGERWYRGMLRKFADLGVLVTGEHRAGT